MKRRDFLKLMGAIIVMGSLAGCARQPKEKIVPYVRSPEDMVPGRPLFFATAMPFAGAARGILVESHMGRPTKIEGNPLHPDSRGATNIFTQASILSLYDPDRSKEVIQAGKSSSWEAFWEWLGPLMKEQKKAEGRGVGIITGTVISPTALNQFRRIIKRFPEAQIYTFDALDREAAVQGTEIVFGERYAVRYDFERADVIVSLDSDFLVMEPGSLSYAREFASRRRITDQRPKLNRIYVFEPTPSITGSVADHRFPVHASEVELLAREIAAGVGVPGVVSAPRAQISPIIADLREHRGSSLVLAGAGQPREVHALAYAINEVLGNRGKTVFYMPLGEGILSTPMRSLKDFTEDTLQNKLDLVFILGVNPAYQAPADLHFREALDRVGFKVHLGLYRDETAERCDWHIPEAHYLESWSDARAYDGTVSVIQPLIEPLWGGKSIHEMLSLLEGGGEKSSHEVVKGFWLKEMKRPNPEKAWEQSLHDGFIPDTRSSEAGVSLVEGFVINPSEKSRQEEAASSGGVEIVFIPDPTIWDGEFSNNAWLQELPKPLTKLTWDNAALVSPVLAERHRLRNGDEIEITLDGRSVRSPVWVLPGQAGNTVTLPLGYGRTHAGRLGKGIGFNAYSIRSQENLWFGSGAGIHKTGKRHDLATTQEHHSMENRHLVREAALPEYRDDPDFARHLGHVPGKRETLYGEEHEKGDYAWGMHIDLNTCIGCNACVIACQSENNIPVVGKKEVANGREMHWIRVDRYFEGKLDEPAIRHQPVPCMHCENAPCEPVCPVAATTHSKEGLNQQIYNRCVGTRYCANNCPYKVRRFNFYNYARAWAPEVKMLMNPDVTIRSRGVMEKCTYCVQRINHARIESKKEDRRIRDGEVMTACQQACPTRAIAFGDISDPGTDVSKKKALPLNYGILAELNTRPRTTYGAIVRNPNPKLQSHA